MNTTEHLNLTCARLMPDCNSQQAKSRRGFEKSMRRFRRLGIPTLAELTEQPRPEHHTTDVDLADCSPAEAAVVSKLQEPCFIVEWQGLSETWYTLEGPNYRSEVAKDLIEPTQNHARLNLGTRYRIRRNDGTRAVHRIAAREDKRGKVEFYKWST